jgi:hypothetical protein
MDRLKWSGIGQIRYEIAGMIEDNRMKSGDRL